MSHSAGEISIILRVIPMPKACLSGRLPVQIAAPISPAEVWDLQVKRLFLWLFVVMLDSCLDNSGLLLCLNPTNELLEELSVGLERFF